MKKLILILIVVSILFYPAVLFADTYDNFDAERNSCENQLSSIWVILKVQDRIISEIRKSLGQSTVTQGDTYNTTVIESSFIVEYAVHTDGPWTKNSYTDTKYRRTGYTYEGITTYVVEPIKFVWSDDNTMMFIK
jgi:hypothetical protein